MSTEPIKDELYAPLLIYLLKTIDLDDQKAVDFALTTHTIDGRKLVEGTTVVSADLMNYYRVRMATSYTSGR
jgi:hypothetical protein